MFGEAPFGGGVTRVDQQYAKLKEIFDHEDSFHIFQAIKNDCIYFLTLDKKTILSIADANKKVVKEITQMKFVSPVQLSHLLSRK